MSGFPSLPHGRFGLIDGCFGIENPSIRGFLIFKNIMKSCPVKYKNPKKTGLQFCNTFFNTVFAFKGEFLVRFLPPQDKILPLPIEEQIPPDP